MKLRSMDDGLVALVLGDSGVLCPGCARGRYPEEDYPEDSTPVFDHDDWKSTVTGPCVGEGCEVVVGEEFEP